MKTKRPAHGKSVKRGGHALLSGPLLVLALATFAIFSGFQLLLSVVPLYAEEAGGGNPGAGLATAVFMLSTVLTQVQMPRLLNRFGYAATLSAGLLFLGLPCFLYPMAQGLGEILAVTLARGVGFGIATVIFAALVIELAPPERRGEALGVFGVAITLPSIFCNPLGLWLVDLSGYGAVFVLAGATTLIGLVAVPGIRAIAPLVRGQGSGAGFLKGLGRGPLLRLFLLFCTATSATGVLVTFLPLAISGRGVFSPATALLVFGVTSTASRWWAGRFGDRRDPHLLLAPGLLAAALGMAVLPQGGLAMLAGTLFFGAGLGLLQNSTLILTMDRVSEEERGLGSTIWNVSFDAGTGAGAFLFGFLVGSTGFAAAFYISATILLAAILIVVLDRSGRRGPSLTET